MNYETLHLDADETIIFSVRKHWFVLALEVFGLAVVALLPLLLYAFGASSISEAMGGSSVPYFIACYAIWLMGVWMALFSIWTNYYLDVWTLTNKRFIAVDQHGLFHRTTASFRLDRLQDVTISVRGIIQTFLHFGALEVQTAGEEQNFRVTGLPDPEVLKSQILDAAGSVQNGARVL